MIEIKNLEGIVTRLYSFETEKDLKSFQDKFEEDHWDFINYPILFSGTKSELREKPNEWWEGIVKPLTKGWKNYDGKNIWTISAKESGLSLLESVKEYVIIVCIKI
jgi:hypothetical protein